MTKKTTLEKRYVVKVGETNSVVAKFETLRAAIRYVDAATDLYAGYRVVETVEEVEVK